MPDKTFTIENSGAYYDPAQYCDQDYDEMHNCYILNPESKYSVMWYQPMFDELYESNVRLSNNMEGNSTCIYNDMETDTIVNFVIKSAASLAVTAVLLASSFLLI